MNVLRSYVLSGCPLWLSVNNRSNADVQGSASFCILHRFLQFARCIPMTACVGLSAGKSPLILLKIPKRLMDNEKFRIATQMPPRWWVHVNRSSVTVSILLYFKYAYLCITINSAMLLNDPSLSLRCEAKWLVNEEVSDFGGKNFQFYYQLAFSISLTGLNLKSESRIMMDGFYCEFGFY